MTERLLVVDDDRLLREVVGEYLVSHGYEVEMADSGQSAIGIFEPFKYRIAILDYVMPGMNGLELMDKLRKKDPDLYYIIMTGYPTLDMAYKAMIEGVSDYIIKPFHLSELLEAIRRIV